MTQAKPQGPLAGIRVLDMSRILAGPWVGQLLADLGAEVIKIERPGKGDDTRAWGPPFVKDRDGNDTTDAAYFMCANRGKKSLTLDIAKPEGQQIIRELAQKSDVLLENYKVGDLKRYGLDYDALSALNPCLVYCSITGFGQTGPYKHRPGYDTIIQAIGGLMSLTGRQDGSAGAGPIKAGVAVTDLMTALYSAVAILAAVNERTRSGQGQYIDMSLLDVQVASLANIAMNYLVSGAIPARMGNRLPTVYPSDAFRCRDGDVMIIVGNDEQFRRFCTAIGRPDAAADARFGTNALRLRNADALAQIIAAALPGDTVQMWVKKFEAAGIASSPINDVAQVFQDPQVVARGVVGELQHPSAGPTPSMASPIRLSRTPATHSRPPPRLGEHTAEVLAEVLALSEADIERIITENSPEQKHVDTA